MIKCNMGLCQGEGDDDELFLWYGSPMKGV